MKLTVSKQPLSEFYKDEGGKGNHLACVVQLTRKGKTLKVPREQKLVLKASLYFESELKVEERDQSILNMQGNEFDPPVLDAKTSSVTVRFRLEKVR